MSDKTTEPTNGARTFEERVFARFDAMDNRFDGMVKRFNAIDERFVRIEGRLETLEARQYDTKLIWEQALAAIAETNSRMSAGFNELNAKYDALGSKVDKLGAELAATKQKMDAGFVQIRTDMDFALRGVERKIDVLNKNILDLRAEQRYVDSRLEKLESQPKPS